MILAIRLFAVIYNIIITWFNSKKVARIIVIKLSNLRLKEKEYSKEYNCKTMMKSNHFQHFLHSFQSRERVVHEKVELIKYAT